MSHKPVCLYELQSFGHVRLPLVVVVSERNQVGIRRMTRRVRVMRLATIRHGVVDILRCSDGCVEQRRERRYEPEEKPTLSGEHLGRSSKSKPPASSRNYLEKGGQLRSHSPDWYRDLISRQRKKSEAADSDENSVDLLDPVRAMPPPVEYSDNACRRSGLPWR